MVQALMIYFMIGETTTYFRISTMIVNFFLILVIVFISASQEEIYGEDAIAEPRFGSYTIGVTCAFIALPAFSLRKVGGRVLRHISVDTIMIQQSKFFIPAIITYILVYYIFFWEDAKKMYSYSGSQFFWLFLP